MNHRLQGNECHYDHAADEIALHIQILKKIQHSLKHRWRTRLQSQPNLNHSFNLDHDYHYATVDIWSRGPYTWKDQSPETSYLGYISVFNSCLRIVSMLETKCFRPELEIPLEDPHCFDKIIWAAHRFWDKK